VLFYKNCGRINIITNNQNGKIIKAVKAAINKAKICKKPIACYDKIIQNQPSPNNTQKLYDN
jgi:putative cell division related rod shape-determining membrane protein